MMRPASLSLLFVFNLIQSGLILAHDTSGKVIDSSYSGQVKAYYPSYNAADGQSISEINYELYTDLIFFSVIPQANNTLSFDPALTVKQGEDMATEFVSKCKKNKVNPLLSLGGWGGSRFFSNLTVTESSRQAFAKEIVNFSQRLGFTGVELDWEYPNGAGIGCNSGNKQDTVNFGLLCKDIRTLWPEASLTAAISINGLIGSDGSVANASETSLLVQNLDFINLMAYDVYGSWAPTTGPIAPLSAKCAPSGFDQSVETGYEIALKQGFKSTQIVLGIPGYAKRSELTSPKLAPTVVDGTTSYYYQNHTSVTPPGGMFDDKPGVDICGTPTTWSGSFLVKELISNGWLSQDQESGTSGYKRHFDECSGMPFLTNGTYFISYDDKQSTVAKAEFAKEKNLGGIYFFDTQGPPDATVQAARKVMNPKEKSSQGQKSGATIKTQGYSINAEITTTEEHAWESQS